MKHIMHKAPEILGCGKKQGLVGFPETSIIFLALYPLHKY